MQAFPKDSLNNSISGSGPVDTEQSRAMFMGQGQEEAYQDFSRGGRRKPISREEGDNPIFNPATRIDMIHGDQSDGLGTSTFLEGAPAARSAITRTREQRAQEITEGGALQRKKSLAQRIRHMNKGPRDQSSPSRVMSPDAYRDRVGSASAATADRDLFSDEFSKGEDSISVRPREGAMSPDSPPRRGSGAALERRATADAAMSSEEPAAKPSGILGRMKSLKGGRRPSRTADGPASPPRYAGADA